MFIQPGRLASLLQIARVGSWINDVHKIANDTSQAGIHHTRTKMSAWPELSGTCHVMLTQDRFWSMQKRCHDWSKRSQTGDFSTVIGTGVLFDLLSLNGQVKSRADPNNAYEVSKKKKEQRVCLRSTEDIWTRLGDITTVTYVRKLLLTSPADWNDAIEIIAGSLYIVISNNNKYIYAKNFKEHIQLPCLDP